MERFLCLYCPVRRSLVTLHVLNHGVVLPVCPAWCGVAYRTLSQSLTGSAIPVANRGVKSSNLTAAPVVMSLRAVLSDSPNCVGIVLSTVSSCGLLNLTFGPGQWQMAHCNNCVST
jgi:hypothetical protein